MGMLDDMAAGPPPTSGGAFSLDDMAAGPPKAPDPTTYHPGVFQTLLDQFQGEQTAGAQGTTPVVRDIKGNLNYTPLGALSEDETGHQGFAGPRNAKGSSAWTAFDPKQHVILKDPATGKMMIYARGDQTNTNPIASLGHVLLPGMASMAPEGLAVAAPRALAAGAPLTTAEAASMSKLPEGAGFTINGKTGSIINGKPVLAEAPAGAPVPVLKPGSLAERTAALDAAGIDPSLSAASPNRGVGVTSKMVGDTVVGGTISARTQTQFSQAGERAANIASNLSDVTEPATAGENVKAAANTYFDTVAKGQENDLYNEARGFLKPTMGAEPSSTLPTARRAVDQLEGAISDPAIRSFVTDKNFTSPADTIRSAGEAGASFDDLRQLRSQVRLLKPSAESKVGINKVAVNRIYDALTTDMKTAADIFGGPQAVDAFNRADSYTRAVEAVHKPALESILDAKSGEDVFRKIQQWASAGSGADWRRLNQLKDAVDGKTWRDVASAVITKMGEPAAGAKSVPGATEFSPASYMTNYAKLSDKAKGLLFDAATRSALDTLAKASGILKQAEKLGNPSGSGRFGTAAAVGAGLINPATTFLTLKALGGGFIASKILASPKIVRWMAGVTSAAKSGNGPALSAVAKQLPFVIGQGEQGLVPALTSWLDTVRQEAGTSPSRSLSTPSMTPLSAVPGTLRTQ